MYIIDNYPCGERYEFICGLLYAHAMGSDTRSLRTTWLPSIFHTDLQ